MSEVLPQPGEVWICCDPKYGPRDWQTIEMVQPFIVTYVSTGQVGYASAGNGPDGKLSYFRRGYFDWDKHFTRIWPPAPTWKEISTQKFTDDLRSQVLTEQRSNDG